MASVLLVPQGAEEGDCELALNSYIIHLKLCMVVSAYSGKVTICAFSPWEVRKDNLKLLLSVTLRFQAEIVISSLTFKLKDKSYYCGLACFRTLKYDTRLHEFCYKSEHLHFIKFAP